MKLFTTAILLLTLTIPTVGYGQSQLSAPELKKDLTIVNLRIENMVLRYRSLKRFQEQLKTRILQLESAARKQKKEKNGSSQKQTE